MSKRGDMMPDSEEELELISIHLSTLDVTIPLSREASAFIWEAVKRGVASSPEEFVNSALDRWYADQKKDAEQSSR